MPDAELTAGLKQAKSKKMFFAFVPKGADGKLIVLKSKIPAKLIADAKKEIGGGNAVTGKCFGGDGGAMVFQVAKAAPPALAAAVKKVAKRDTGLSIDPDFQLAGDADAEEPVAGVVAGLAPAAGTGQADDADDDAQGIGQEAETAEEDADAAALQAKAAADKAQIMKRLTALVGPYKEAVAANGPNVQRLQALLGSVKSSIAKQQFTQAGDGLDMMEDVLAEKPTPSPDVADEDDDLKPDGQEDDGANPEDDDDADKAAAVGAKVTPAPFLDPNVKFPELDAASKDGAGLTIDFGDWKAAKQNAAVVAKALAGKVAGTKHALAVGVLKEINSIIGFVKKLPDNPPPEQIDKIAASITQHEAIAAAEDAPGHFAGKVDISKPLLDALQRLK